VYDFKLPDIGEGIHEAEIIEWKVTIGDRVHEGDSLVSVSTDKVDVELPSPRSGVVSALHGEAGDVITVGTVIVRIDVGDERTTAGHVQAAGAAVPTTPGDSRESAAGDGQRGRAPVSGSGPAPLGRKVRASPSTRKFAAEHRIDLSRIHGSGVQGRILRRDVEACLARTPVPAPAAPAAAAIRRERLSAARSVAAERLARSARTFATTTLSFEAVGDGIRCLLDDLAPDAAKRKVKLTPLAVIAKCVASALRENPRFNATVDEEANELVMYDTVDLGIAVAGASGLIVPIVRRVEKRSLFDIAAVIQDIATRGRAGRLEISDLRGGGFTISSTGGLERASMVTTTPVINWPHVATLWVSRITDRPRVIDGELSGGPMLMCSLSFDHRYIDGVEGTTFINDLVELLQAPARVLA
jgi:pyruvate/2-oxoglutarate dehydrogenase complex dihydrolipoamide acyltransferase (E2) component